MDGIEGKSIVSAFSCFLVFRDRSVRVILVFWVS